MELKERLFKLLEEDKEFRLAVAGMLGFGDIMRRLEEHDRKFNEILEEIRGIKEEQARHTRILEEHSRILKGHTRILEEHSRILKGHTRILEEHSRILKGHTRILEEHSRRLEEHDRKFNEILEELRVHREILREHSILLHRYITTMEEEAHEVIAYRLREKGIPVELSMLTLPGLEINVYGTSDDVCVVGETAVRLGRKKVEELEEKLKILKSRYPNLLRPKVIPVLYVMRATDEAIKRARDRGIWVLTASRELVSFPS